MNKRLLVAVTLICAAFSACDLNQMLPNIQTGSNTFTVNSHAQIATLEYQQNFQSNFESEPQVALMVNGFYLNAASVKDWQITVGSVTKQSVKIIFKHNSTEWQALHYSYFASTRPEIQTGSIVSSFNNLKNSFGTIQVKLDKSIEKFQSYICRAYINGFKQNTLSPIFSRIVDAKTFRDKEGKQTVFITFQISGSMTISRYAVSYIAFDPKRASFASFGGAMTENNLSEPKRVDINKNGTVILYPIMGITLLRQANDEPINIKSSISAGGIAKIGIQSGNISQLGLSYIAIGVPSKNACGDCSAKCVYEAKCLPACPSNTVSYSDNSGTQVCREQVGAEGVKSLPSGATAALVNLDVLKGGQGPNVIRRTQSAQQPIQPMPQSTLPPALPQQQQSGASQQQFIPLIRVPIQQQAQQVQQAQQQQILQSIQQQQTQQIQQQQYTQQQAQEQFIQQQQFGQQQQLAQQQQKQLAQQQQNEQAGTQGFVPQILQQQARVQTQQPVQQIRTQFAPVQQFVPEVQTVAEPIQQLTPQQRIQQLIQQRQQGQRIQPNQQPSVSATVTVSNSQNSLPNVVTSSINVPVVNPQVNILPNNNQPFNVQPQPQPFPQQQQNQQQIQLQPQPQPFPFPQPQPFPFPQPQPQSFSQPQSSFPQQQPFPQPQQQQSSFPQQQPFSQPQPFPQPSPQAYVASGPTQPPLNIITVPVVSVIPLPPQGDCSSQPNTYWTGYRCACRVGYSLSNNVCMASQTTGQVFRPAEFIYKISLLYRQGSNSQCNREFEVFNGVICDCIPGYTRNDDGSCRNGFPSNNCPENSVLIMNNCKCLPNFEMRGNVCIRKNALCDENSFDNGFGACICRQGFVKYRGSCIPGDYCPPFSESDGRGNCNCIAGYKKYNGACSVCPPGQISIDGNCIYTCGVNEIPNSQTGKCECKPNLGRYNGVCNTCPIDFFIKDGYCVTCPLKAQLNKQTNQCVCPDGNQLVGGICQDKCPRANEVFSAQLNKCVCFDGLGRVNNICQVCSNGWIDPITQQCNAGCRANEVSLNNKCVCQSGFGRNHNQDCIDCSTIRGFESLGFCVTCPLGQIVQNNQCACPAGKVLVGDYCVNACKTGQVIDSNGVCYWCPVNEEPIDGRCDCKPGYNRNNQYCQIYCPPNSRLIQGVCATCAMGTEFDSTLNACVCPAGTYKDQNNFCTKIQVNCQVANCLTCTSPSTCDKCQYGYQPKDRSCQAVCGDGIVAGNELCDDGNANNNDGCSITCVNEPGFTCTGVRPTTCIRNIAAVCGNRILEGNERCDDGNISPNDGCFNCQVQPGWICNHPAPCFRDSTPPPPPPPPKPENLFLFGRVEYPSTRIIKVNLGTLKQYPNLSPQEQKSFIKYEFLDKTTVPASSFCNQNKPDLFSCIFSYGTGTPNKIFNVNFSYNYNGDSGQTTVPLNPLAATRITSRGRGI